MKSLLSLFVVFTLCSSSLSADYLAYAKIKGDRIPLPEDLDPITSGSPKDLMDVEYGEYQGPKSRIGVLPVENSSSTATHNISFSSGGEKVSYSSADYNQVPVNGIDAMITDILNNTGRFRIVERQVLSDLLDEQDLGASGRVAQPSAAKVGNVLGASTFIKAVVTSYEPNYKGSSFGLGGLTKGALGGLKVGGSKSMVQMAFRLIDAETSEVTYSKQVEIVMSDKSLGFGGAGWGGGGVLGGAFSNYAKTPIGQSVIIAVNAGIYDLIKEIGLQPTEGSVIQVTPNGQIAINLGEGAIDVGDELEAISKGEEFVDPDTGLSLGSIETTVGRVKIVNVQEKFSFGKALDFEASSLTRGDKLVSTADAGSFEFGDSWNEKGKRNGKR